MWPASTVSMPDADPAAGVAADRDRPLELSVIAASLILFAPIVSVLLTRRVFVIGDLVGFHLPTRYLFAQALRAGDSPWWTPSLFGGFFLLGDGQVGMLHPWHFLLYRWLPLESALALEV